ncbi:RES family NAD+ phosphorylase [Salinisphaera japonica]|uniref:RES family NAD+ phosphorylase n=1 Tax=Salinisphaera japonica TaxID=1304270 RepID=UPI000F4CE6AE|nr:RES family NAD+ phosphorylase [Salinisphaera japonica]
MPQTTGVDWPSARRIVPSRFPPRTLFDRVADPADLQAVYELESLTNDRLRDEVGHITRVPAAERMAGPGATPIMAAFTHLNPAGSRFSDGSYGVFYAGRDRRTAVRETVYHRERFLAASQQPPMTLEMREYRVAVAGALVDLRDIESNDPRLAGDDYSAAQRFAAGKRQRDALGIVYPSVRDPGGECVAAFRTTPLSPAVQCGHLGYIWDGRQITDVIELGDSGITPHV